MSSPHTCQRTLCKSHASWQHINERVGLATLGRGYVGPPGRSRGRPLARPHTFFGIILSVSRGTLTKGKVIPASGPAPSVPHRHWAQSLGLRPTGTTAASRDKGAAHPITLVARGLGGPPAPPHRIEPRPVGGEDVSRWGSLIMASVCSVQGDDI